MVSGDHESRGGELGEARVAQPRKVLEGERGQVVLRQPDGLGIEVSGQDYYEVCPAQKVGQRRP